MREVLIVLSSYNGAKYIGEQIESIRQQRFREWRLLIRDDGSVDSTVEVIQRFARADSRISLISDGQGHLGAVASFGALLDYALAQEGEYVALSDQDDVWRADKLERQLELLQTHEASLGSEHPMLVHSDLAVVDSDLRLIHPSFRRYQRLEPIPAGPLRRLLLQNFVTGCTVVLNRALLRLAAPLPNVLMHDWWLAQCAAAMGSLLFLPEATVLYRQHGSNLVGGRGIWQRCLDVLRNPMQWWARSGGVLAATSGQVCGLANRLASLPASTAIESETRRLVQRTCVALSELGPLDRCLEVCRLGIRPRSLRLLLRILVGVRRTSTASPVVVDGWLSHPRVAPSEKGLRNSFTSDADHLE